MATKTLKQFFEATREEKIAAWMKKMAREERKSREEENLRLYGSKTRPKKRDPFKMLEKNRREAGKTRAFVRKGK